MGLGHVWPEHRERLEHVAPLTSDPCPFFANGKLFIKVRRRSKGLPDYTKEASMVVGLS